MAASGKSVIILGAGMCGKPIVHYLCQKGHTVFVGSRTLSKAEDLCKGSPAKAIQLDIDSKEGEELVDEYAQKVDAIVSLLPPTHHIKAAQYALKYSKHFMTSSYVSEEMKALGPEATEKNLVFINECGVDPGTDHMSAMRVIDGVRAKGGKITGFLSYCGGLPHPKDNDNPLGYKFSWAPRGVLTASRNTAEFLLDGKEVTIDGEVLFDNYNEVKIPGMGTFESYPNRNSKKYVDVYGIKDTKTIIRGTFRNVGWCAQIKKLVECGYLTLEEKDYTEVTYLQMLAEMVKTEEKDEAGVMAAVCEHLKVEPAAQVISTMKWLGCFSDRKVGAPRTPLDALCVIMKEKMPYGPKQRDMLLMRHDFEAEYPDGSKEKLSSTMVTYGDLKKGSAMSRTVSLPLAMAVNMVLTGVFTKPGLSIPVIPELYTPILDELATNGITWKETCEKVV